jgi:hypothetical protein
VQHAQTPALYFPPTLNQTHAVCFSCSALMASGLHKTRCPPVSSARHAATPSTSLVMAQGRPAYSTARCSRDAALTHQPRQQTALMLCLLTSAPLAFMVLVKGLLLILLRTLAACRALLARVHLLLAVQPAMVSQHSCSNRLLQEMHCIQVEVSCLQVVHANWLSRMIAPPAWQLGMQCAAVAARLALHGVCLLSVLQRWIALCCC